MNGHQEEDSFASNHQEEDVGRAVAESLPKNIIARTPRARFARGRGFRRHLLSRYATGKPKGRLRCGLLEAKWKIWTDRGLQIYGYDGEGERQRRIPGDGNQRDQFASIVKERNSRDDVN